MVEDKKKYNFMENVLNEINSKFVSLPDDHVKKNNEILQDLLDLIINRMKEIDPLFKAMFTRVFYGGSYYDGLRVGEPDEFDLDLLLTLPKYAEPVLTTSNIPGFVHVQLKNYEGWMRQPEAWPAYQTFKDLLDQHHFLNNQKVLSWMEGVVQRTINTFTGNSGARYQVAVHQRVAQYKSVALHKSGPALTLKLTGPGVKMDIDLVPSFAFSSDEWPKNGFRSNPVPSKPNFFIVAKKPKQASETDPVERYWRLSFQEQERVLIDGKRTLKPTIKLLKKLRDVSQHNCIASYYIKTVLLHMVEEETDEFWQNSLSYVFMTVLKRYRECIENGKIPYYWYKKNNLIGRVNEDTLENINNRLKVVISDVEKNSNFPTRIAKFLLTDEEYNTFMIGKL